MAKLKKLPNVGRVFSKAVYCHDDTPTITYHNVKVDNIYIPKKNPKMESYATLVSNEFHGYILVKVYIMDLGSWRFIK